MGLLRNWKDMCPICLEDFEKNIYSEIIILRPCGHCLCSKCFYKLMDINSLYVNNLDEIDYRLLKGSNYNISEKCPVCRQILCKGFRAERVRVDSLKIDIDKFGSLLWSSFPKDLLD